MYAGTTVYLYIEDANEERLNDEHVPPRFELRCQAANLTTTTTYHFTS
jgi:hypothetical protein